MSIKHKQAFKRIEAKKNIVAMAANIKLNNHLRKERSEIILDTVSKVFEVLPSDILGKRRLHEYSEPRHAFIYLYNMLCPRTSLTEIGRHLNRNHSTIISSLRRCEDLMHSDDIYATTVTSCLHDIRSKHPWMISDGKKKLRSQRTWTSYQLNNAAALTLDFIEAWDKYVDTGDAEEFMTNCTMIRLHAMGLDKEVLNDPPVTIPPQFNFKPTNNER